MSEVTVAAADGGTCRSDGIRACLDDCLTLKGHENACHSQEGIAPDGAFFSSFVHYLALRDATGCLWPPKHAGRHRLVMKRCEEAFLRSPSCLLSAQALEPPLQWHSRFRQAVPDTCFVK